MNRKITIPAKIWMKRLSYRRPSSSGNVCASRWWPILRVGGPRNTNATNMPMKMFRKVSHRRLMPNRPATPPNPTMADVLMNVAP